MGSPAIDYTALVKQAGAVSSTPGKVDYAALARQAGAVSSAPPPTPAPAVQPGNALTSGHFWDTVKANYNDALTPKPGISNNFSRGVTEGLVAPAVHPLDTLSGMAHSVLHPIDTVTNLANGVKQDYQQNGAANATSHLAGQLSGGFIGGELAGAGVGKILQGAKALPDVVAAPLRANLDEPMQGTTLTPRARYQSAKNVGVQLDAADATNSGPLKMVKAVNQHGLLSEPTYDAAKTRNFAALDSARSNFLNAQGPDLGTEQSGRLVQAALKGNQEDLQRTATEGFNSLPQDLPIPGSEAVGRTAQEIAKNVAQYQERYPSLVPRQTMGVVGDVSGLAPKPLPPGVAGPLPMPRPTNFGEMQQLRSDLLESGRTNPDLVKNQAGGWLKQLSGTTDAAMTDAAGGLDPAQQAAFRDANARWADMKNTYDDPSSPFYHAVRTPNVSNLADGGFAGKTPEGVRNLFARISDDAQGAVRRSAAENLFGANVTGDAQYRNFGGRLFKMPDEYRSELFGDDGKTLTDMAHTTHALNSDLNPSGTAKMGQKSLEAAALVASPLHPTAAVLPLLQYPVAKMMNSPALTDFLMRQPAPATAPSIPFLPLPARQKK